MPAHETYHRLGWIICQIGARESYAIARALGRRGALSGVVTDAWVAPNSAASVLLPQRMRERWHPDLSGENIRAPSFKAGDLVNWT